MQSGHACAGFVWIPLSAHSLEKPSKMGWKRKVNDAFGHLFAVSTDPVGTVLTHCVVVDSVPEQAQRDPADPKAQKGVSKVVPTLKKAFPRLPKMKVE